MPSTQTIAHRRFFVYTNADTMEQELQTALSTVSGLSYLGIFGVSLLANMIVPVPEEVFLLALGYLVAKGFFHPVVIVGIVIVGFMISDTVLFFLARKGNRFLIRIRDLFMKRLALTNSEFVISHMNKIIFFSRFLIQFRFLGPVIAGSYAIPYRHFFKINLFALCVYVPLVIVAGHYFENRIGQIASGVGVVRNIILIAVGVLIVVTLFKLMRTLFVRYVGGFEEKVRTALGKKKKTD